MLPMYKGSSSASEERLSNLECIVTFILVFMLLITASGCQSKTQVIELFEAFKEATQTHTPTPTERPTKTPTATFTPTITVTPTETPTPTEKPLIEGNIFYDPQSKEDFKNVVMAPSPIYEPEEFSQWQDKYLELVLAKLENYEGPDVHVSYHHYTSNGHDAFDFFSDDWPVIASYKFLWKGQEMLSKSFIFKNYAGEVFTLTFTFATEDASFYRNPENPLYSTPPNDEVRYIFSIYKYGDVRYEIDKNNNHINQFTLDFLGRESEVKPNNIDTKLLRRYILNPTDEDKIQVIRFRLIIAKISNIHYAPGVPTRIPDH